MILPNVIAVERRLVVERRRTITRRENVGLSLGTEL